MVSKQFRHFELFFQAVIVAARWHWLPTVAQGGVEDQHAVFGGILVGHVIVPWVSRPSLNQILGAFHILSAREASRDSTHRAARSRPLKAKARALTALRG